MKEYAWYEENLICPIDNLPLKIQGQTLLSPKGRTYPIVNGIPVMLCDEAPPTLSLIESSLAYAKAEKEFAQGTEHLFLESVGISQEDRIFVMQLFQEKKIKIDPVVSCLIGATNGNGYVHLIKKLEAYPIPALKLPAVEKNHHKKLLDIGCSWGRWSVAAARKGYEVVGIDPSLGAIAAAKRVSEQLQLPIKFIVADARYLPFKKESFDQVFSYSVLQHFSKEDVRLALQEVSRILKENGKSLIQMQNSLGARNLQVQLKRKFRKPKDFEVRYWPYQQLKKTFEEKIGKTKLAIDCYFGLGLQAADMAYMPLSHRLIIRLSEFLIKLSKKIIFLKYFSDSLYVESVKLSSK